MAVKQIVQLRLFTSKEIWPELKRVLVMVMITYGAALHHTISDNQNVNSVYYHKFLETHLHPAEQ